MASEEKPTRRLLKLADVAAACGMSNRWVWREVSAHRFPKPLYPNGSRCARWDSIEVDGWMDSLRRQRDEKGAGSCGA
jgi:predicted DNA-binding transcriptional regulator AlpA